jgi:hypothetical protein
MKKVLFVAIMLLGTLSVSAKNVVKITTSCDKVAYIDTERGSMSQVMQQVMAIDDALCGD